MDNVYRVKNFLLPEELEVIEHILTDEDEWMYRSEKKHDPVLGRLMYVARLPMPTLEGIQERVEKLVGRKLPQIGVMFVDYDAKYGQPNLPPHFDGDNNGLIIDYQYKSNTTWGLAVDKEVFEMEDNEAIIFNPNEYPHWRPHKTFKEGEFITMAFFRFIDEDLDYSHMRYLQDDPIFDEAHKIRDSLNSDGIK